MFGDEKNLKDSKSDREISIKDSVLSIAYLKTTKLITGLYMVTDIIDKDEPLRNKLRTLGTEIISDMNSVPSNACLKISEIMSFLDIASTLNIISEMNCRILKKEFIQLDQSIKESSGKTQTFSRQVSLSEFFREELPSPSIGHARIGVQKGSTLMKALSNVKMSDRNTILSDTKNSFDVLKKERRDEVISILKTNLNGATITDIKTKATGTLISCSEKTLQRELVSMLQDGVLKKIGEKRWSRYFMAN